MRQALVVSILAAAAVGCGSVSGDLAETTAVACQDGEDNDEDGDADCADADCAGFVFCVAPTEDTGAACDDGADNDGDGDTDCADADCAGFVFCGTPTENDATSCDNGADDDGDGDTDCADAGCAAFCGVGGNEATHASCADLVDNDGDGDADCADPDCATVAYCGGANGFPRVDPWGDVWDGFPRLAAHWDVARADCLASGGRLPTATEVYRNGNHAIGSGLFDEDWMWTFLVNRNGMPVVVRAVDGGTSWSEVYSERIYRCVWPEEATPGFDHRRCLGPVGGECFAYGRENADAYNRPPLDYASASQECNFYGASIPTAADWGELTHAGIPFGTGNWLWNANPTYGNEYGYIMTVSAFTAYTTPHWGFSSSNNNGTIDYGYNQQRFRCVGLADPADAIAPTNPTCQGGCLVATARRSPIHADTIDRGATTWDVAAETCRSIGGELPNLSDFSDLVRGGWTSSGGPLWLAHGNYWYSGNYGPMAASIPSAPAARWIFDTYGALTYPTTAYSYRCVFRSSRGSLPSCNGDQIVVDEGDALVCDDPVAGDSDGMANPGGTQILDRFGNAWDTIQRSTASYAVAVATCTTAGGRLPTASELWGARNGEPVGPAIGDINSTSYLWTKTHSYEPNYQIVARISDGDADHAPLSGSQPYRCVWPSTRGDVMAGQNCYGPAGDGCFAASGKLVADAYDRIALPVPSAIEECRASGGRLPDLRDFTTLTHAGWPNGSNTWLSVNDALYWYSGGYGYLLGRWAGTGTTGWSYGKNQGDWGDLTWFYSWNSFRCVYSTLDR